MSQVVIYARVSSREQEREGYSIPAQLGLLREYAKRNNLNIVQEFTESETAKSAGREQFNNMLALLKQKDAPKIVLVEKTDRLYRNFKDYVAVEELMTSTNVEVHLVKESEILSADSRSSLKFIHGIKVLMAKNYIDNLSEEIKKGQRQKLLEGGWPWAAPYGYQMLNRELVVDPDRAPFVQRAFELYSTNMYSLIATREKLFEEGFIYRPYLPKIGKAALHSLLQNRLYIGELEFQDEVYPGRHQPLISMQVWKDVQASFRKDNKPISFNKRDFIFKGILTCDECGRPLVGELKKGKYIYYRCSATKKGCTQGYVSESIIEDSFSETINTLVFPSNIKEKILTAYKELEDTITNTANDELERLNKEEQKVLKLRRVAYQDKLEEKIPDDMWNDISKDFQTQLDQLKAAREKVAIADCSLYEIAERLLELPEMLSEGWISANYDDKKMVSNLITSNCFVKDGKARLELKEILRPLVKSGQNENWSTSPYLLRNFLIENLNEIKKLNRALSA